MSRATYGPAGQQQGGTAVASDGFGYLVVWEDRRAGALSSDIYATRVTATGKVLDRTGFPVSRARHAQAAPVVT